MLSLRNKEARFGSLKLFAGPKVDEIGFVYQWIKDTKVKEWNMRITELTIEL